jgi:hypothetical protein
MKNLSTVSVLAQLMFLLGNTAYGSRLMGQPVLP